MRCDWNGGSYTLENREIVGSFLNIFVWRLLGVAEGQNIRLQKPFHQGCFFTISKPGWLSSMGEVVTIQLFGAGFEIASSPS